MEVEAAGQREHAPQAASGSGGTCAVPTLSITMGLMSPAAYLTSASAKLPSRKATPTFSLACARRASSEPVAWVGSSGRGAKGDAMEAR